MKVFSPLQIRSRGFTLMEILVVIAIILVLAAIAFPVITTVQSRANKAVAMANMRNLGAGLGAYVSQNDGQLPPEDSKGIDTWANAAAPENVKVWYNSIPALMGNKGVGQYSTSPQAFYSKENMLFIPGALYPETDKKLAQPLFAVAINTKLHRKDKSGDKSALRISQLPEPSRTVLFLEQGLKGEPKAMAQQPKYDGSPKGSAKSFVARYNGVGWLTFVDGHAELVKGEDILEENGTFKWPLEPGDIIWGRSREEADNPNVKETQ